MKYSSHDRRDEALAFVYGYSGSSLEYVVEQWPELMRTKAGRDKALTWLKRSAAPFSVGIPALADWVDQVRADAKREVS